MRSHGAGVLDTSVVIALGRLQPDALPREPSITAVPLAELSVGPLVARGARERAARRAADRTRGWRRAVLPSDG